MPVWLMICFGAVPGVLGLVMAAVNMGSLRRDVHSLVERSKGWDTAVTDLAYIKGRLEESDVTRMTPTSRRKRIAAVA